MYTRTENNYKNEFYSGPCEYMIHWVRHHHQYNVLYVPVCNDHNCIYEPYYGALITYLTILIQNLIIIPIYLFIISKYILLFEHYLKTIKVIDIILSCPPAQLLITRAAYYAGIF